jgi:hypothetical protein
VRGGAAVVGWFNAIPKDRFESVHHAQLEKLCSI